MRREALTTQRRRRRLSRRKKATFAAVTLIVVLAAIEGALALFNLGAAETQPDPFVGFSDYYPLFVETTLDKGARGWRTADNKLAWFNPQAFPDSKPPETCRIFCLGGSTTYGRPYDDATSFCGWLRELLPAVDATCNWEVINAGGISYASYRVARVAEELTRHRPDLFIVYTGHNEFLERRTYGDLAQSSEVLRNAGGWLSRLRTFAVLQSLIGPPSPGPSAPAKLPAEVETILDTSVGLDAYHRDDELRADVHKHYRHNLHRLVDLARGCGARIVFVVPASQLRDCRPFKSEHRSGLTHRERADFDAAFEAARAAQAADDLQQSQERVERALAIDDRFAAAQFLEGEVLWSLERFAQAGEAFVRARDEDVCPLRATSDVGTILREVADERNVPLVDFPRLAEGLTEHGVPGADLFLDHVHPTIEGHRQLALALVRLLTDINMVTPSADWGEKELARVTGRVQGRIDPADHARALANLSKVLSWAGKYEEADRLALEAAELAGDDVETLYQAGSALYRAGDLQAAMEKYQAAVAIDPNSAPAQFGLALTLAESGRTPEAIPHYRRAAALQPEQLEIRFNYGNALLETDEFAAAEREYLAATRIEPDYAPARNSLGIALARQGRISEAADQFRRALAIDPQYADARSNLERALQMLETQAH